MRFSYIQNNEKINIIIDNSWILEHQYMIGGQAVPEYHIYNSADISDVTGWQARSVNYKIVLLKNKLPVGSTIQSILDSLNSLKISGQAFNFVYNEGFYGAFIVEANGISSDIKTTDNNDEIVLCELHIKIKETQAIPVSTIPVTTDIVVTSLNEDIMNNQVIRDKQASDLNSFYDKFNSGVQSLQTFQNKASDTIMNFKEQVENIQGYVVQIQNAIIDVQGIIESAGALADALVEYGQAISSGDLNAIQAANLTFAITNNSLNSAMVNVNRFSYLRL